MKRVLWGLLLLLIVVVGLALAAVPSLLFAQEEEMPILQLETYLPTVQKGRFVPEFPPCDCTPDDSECVCFMGEVAP